MATYHNDVLMLLSGQVCVLKDRERREAQSAKPGMGPQRSTARQNVFGLQRSSAPTPNHFFAQHSRLTLGQGRTMGTSQLA